jgi:hypothetical protein
VTRAVFSHGDQFLITVGGNDKSVLIWETDFGLKQKEMVDDDSHDEITDAELAQLEENLVDESRVRKQTLKDQRKIEDQKKIEEARNNAQEPDLFDFGLYKFEDNVGDEFLAVKPWKQ